MKKCFPPIIDRNSEVLILGSFPGEESLRKKQYYGHPQNQFWRIIGEITCENLNGLEYPEKKKALLKHRIALWDVISSCERPGSLDSSIRNERMNNLGKIHRLAPNIRLIVFNGKKAGKYTHEFKGYRTKVLPSTSPAYTLKYEKKLKEWKAAVGEWTKTR